jgi:hypothetical protein
MVLLEGTVGATPVTLSQKTVRRRALAVRRARYSVLTFIRPSDRLTGMSPEGFENELTVSMHERNGTVEEFHRTFEEAVERIETDLGGSHP